MDNLQWLVENGGPSIKLNMMNEGLIDKNTYDAEKLADKLLQIEKVRTALTYFDKFKDYESMLPTPYKALAGYIHNCYEDCFEMFMPFFISLGFRKGVPVFDEKVEYMRDVYRYLVSVGKGGSGIVIMYMLKAGYFYDDMLDGLEGLDTIYNTAKQQCFDIYETDPAKIRYSKLPNEWKNGPILKDIHIDGELVVPTIYHITKIIYLYKYVKDAETKNKIDTVIEYVMHPEFQKLRGCLGYGWFYNKSYYACSGTLSLPLYEDNAFSRNSLELMSHSPYAVKTEWYQNCINYLEQYKTERGTYAFTDKTAYGSTFDIPRPATPTIVYDAFI